MRVTFLGTGSAMPTGDRYQSGTVLRADGRTLLVDCGAGVLQRLQQSGVGYGSISTVLLTHHHLDHVADLMPLLKARWLAGDEHLSIVGPRGTKALVDGLFDLHEYLDGRIDVSVHEIADGEHEIAGFELRAREVRHSKRTLAYRFDDRLTLSGDTEAFEGLADFADGSAVLVHDCSFPDDVDVDNHPTPTELGRVLADHEYGRVYLTHLYPHTDDRHEEMLDSIGDHYDGDVRFAEDLTTVRIG